MSDAPGPPGPDSSPPPRRFRALAQWLLPLAALGAVVTVFALTAPGSGTTRTFTYSEFLTRAASHHGKSVTLGTKGSATGTLAGGGSYTAVIPTQAGPELLSQLRSDGVSIDATQSSSSAWSGVLGWALLLVPFGLLLWWSSRSIRKMGGPLGSPGGVGKARAQVCDTERPATTFADVAGYEGAKAVIAEVVDFLRSPERYRRAGAVGPKGVLMVGPPGHRQDAPGPGRGRRSRRALLLGRGLEIRRGVRGGAVMFLPGLNHILGMAAPPSREDGRTPVLPGGGVGSRRVAPVGGAPSGA